MLLEKLECLSLFVLQTMSFVYYDVDERNFLKIGMQILHKDLKRSNQDVEFEQFRLLGHAPFVGDIIVEPFPVSDFCSSISSSLIVVEN